MQPPIRLFTPPSVLLHQMLDNRKSNIALLSFVPQTADTLLRLCDEKCLLCPEHSSWSHHNSLLALTYRLIALRPAPEKSRVPESPLVSTTLLLYLVLGPWWDKSLILCAWEQPQNTRKQPTPGRCTNFDILVLVTSAMSLVEWSLAIGSSNSVSHFNCAVKAVPILAPVRNLRLVLASDASLYKLRKKACFVGVDRLCSSGLRSRQPNGRHGIHAPFLVKTLSNIFSGRAKHQLSCSGKPCCSSRVREFRTHDRRQRLLK